MSTTDTMGRPLRDLRISVTDRCNFRCVYCMPKEVFGRDYRFLPRRELLTFEEIERVAGVFVGLGVRKLRLTGGEPLLRRDLEVVVKRGLNEGSVLDMARRFRGTGHTVRFIEYMDVGATNGWRLDDVVSAADIVRTIGAEFPLEPIDADYRGEVAQRYRYRDGAGEIGVVASVTQPFCGDCTRMRLSADGKLYTCLFAVQGHDLRATLRGGATDEELDESIRTIWERRVDRYSELRTRETRSLRKVEMSYIGG